MALAPGTSCHRSAFMDLSSVAPRILPTQCVARPQAGHRAATRCRWFVGEFSPDARRIPRSRQWEGDFLLFVLAALDDLGRDDAVDAQHRGGRWCIFDHCDRDGAARQASSDARHSLQRVGVDGAQHAHSMGNHALCGCHEPLATAKLMAFCRVGFCGMEAPEPGAGPRLCFSREPEGSVVRLASQPFQGAARPGLRVIRAAPRER